MGEKLSLVKYNVIRKDYFVGGMVVAFETTMVIQVSKEKMGLGGVGVIVVD